MKHLFLFIIIVLSFISCSKDDPFTIRELSSEEQIRVSEFEADFVEKVRRNVQTKSESSNDVVLIGFKTVSYHGADSVFVNSLWETYREEIAAYESFLTLDGQARVYFPMSEAIVKYNGTIHIADSCGRITLSGIDYNKVSVVGRNKTDKSVYTKFKCTYRPQNIFNQEKVLVFNLGPRPLCNMENEHNLDRLTRGEGGNVGVPCTQNHSPYPNCTAAYMIAQPRCVTDYTRCMDYNGPGTDCSGSKLYFIGSDCSVAMIRGYCWEEMM